LRVEIRFFNSDFCILTSDFEFNGGIMAQRGENCLILVAGQPTAVTNSTIAGIVDEVGEGVHLADVFGATAGVGGIADGKLMDLGAQKRKTIEGLKRTPGSVLAGRHRVLSEDDAMRIIETLRANEIGTVFFLGGLPAVGLQRYLIEAAEKASYPLIALGAPLSAENEVDAGDHTPGYGSAARFVASTLRDAARDAAGAEEPVTVVEILGAQTGWLAASSALARDASHPAPHAILLPERPLETEGLVDELRRAYQKYGYAVAVTTQGAKSTDGSSLDGAALSQLLGERLGVATRLEKWGATARSSQANIARADAEEAYNLGSLMVRLAGDECSGYVVTVQRDMSERPERGDRETRERGYRSVEGTSRLDQIGTDARPLPAEYLGESNTQVSQAFLDWAKPLIGGALPEYVSLSE
jgi:6-phosphofructokinase